MIDVLAIYALTFAAMHKVAPVLAERLGLLGRTHPLLVPPTPPVEAQGAREAGDVSDEPPRVLWWVVQGRLDHPDHIRVGAETPEEAELAAIDAYEEAARDYGVWIVWLSRLLACAFCAGFHAGWIWAAVSQPQPIPVIVTWGVLAVGGAFLTAHPWMGASWLPLWGLLLALGAVACATTPGVLVLASWGLAGASLSYIIDTAVEWLEREPDSGLADELAELARQVDEIDEAVAGLEDD